MNATKPVNMMVATRDGGKAYYLRVPHMTCVRYGGWGAIFCVGVRRCRGARLLSVRLRGFGERGLNEKTIAETRARSFAY